LFSDATKTRYPFDCTGEHEGAVILFELAFSCPFSASYGVPDVITPVYADILARHAIEEENPQVYVPLSLLARFQYKLADVIVRMSVHPDGTDVTVLPVTPLAIAIIISSLASPAGAATASEEAPADTKVDVLLYATAI